MKYIEYEFKSEKAKRLALKLARSEGIPEESIAVDGEHDKLNEQQPETRIIVRIDEKFSDKFDKIIEEINVLSNSTNKDI